MKKNILLLLLFPILVSCSSRKEINIEMIFVEGGTFQMGGTNRLYEETNPEEYPVHEVEVGDFYIGKYEVTQSQWKFIMGNIPYGLIQGDEFPIGSVSWNDVQVFIQKLNAKTGKKYRLPTEAEWEFAARGGNNSHNYVFSGSNNSEEVAWLRPNSGHTYHPVGMKKPNELGIFDMNGNVWEWCQDYYAMYDNTDNVSDNECVNRGGGYLDAQLFMSVSRRDKNDTEFKYSTIGFRLACDVGNLK